MVIQPPHTRLWGLERALEPQTDLVALLRHHQRRYASTSPVEARAKLPLLPVYGSPEGTLRYLIAREAGTVATISEDGQLELLSADDVEILDDPGECMTSEEFSEITEMAWLTHSQAPFSLGVYLSRYLEDLEAHHFWSLYGCRWLSREGDARAAERFMLEALVVAQLLPSSDRARLTQAFEDFRQAQQLRASGRTLRTLRYGDVAELTPFWRPEYSLPAMAQRAYGNPQVLKNAQDLYSFGPAPFEAGAPSPPPLRDTLEDPLSYLPRLVPTVETPAEPETPDAQELAVVAAAAPAIPPPVVHPSARDLLHAEWSIPASEEAFAQARDVLFRWLGEKLGFTLPELWRQGANEAEHKGVRLESEAGEGLIALRFEHPDHALVARRWRVEIVLCQPDAKAPGVLAVRLMALDSTRLEPPTTGAPRFLTDLLRTPGLIQGNHRLGTAWLVGTNAAWLSLKDMLSQARRDFVVLVSLDKTELELSKALAPLVLHVTLQKACVGDYSRRVAPLEPGQAHVFALGETAPRVLASCDTEVLAPAVWEAHADRRALPPLPTFAEVRRRLRDLSLMSRVRAAPVEAHSPSTAAPTASAAPALPVPTAPPSELDELLQEELEFALADKRALEADNDALRAQLREAKAALYAARLITAAPEPVFERAWRPDSFEGLEAWAPSLATRVLIAPKAIKEALSIIDYQNQGAVIAAIQALHDDYWPMVFGDDPQARERWKQFLAEQRLRAGPVGNAPSSARYGDRYAVTVDGKTYQLDAHIQGHSGRDTRRCLRIYFTTDKETQKLLIGHFPSHLPCYLHYNS